MSRQENIQQVTYKDLLRVLNESSILAFTDANGCITYANDKFCEISKYSRSELLGKNHRLLKSGYHSKDFYKVLWNTISSGNVWIGDIKNRTKDGDDYWVSTTIIPFIDDKGIPFQYAAIRIDITEKKKNEEEHRKSVLNSNVIQAQQQAYEKFVATLVHDLKNPLMVALMSAQVIQKNSDSSKKVETTAAKIISTLKRVDGMLSSILETNSKKNDLIFSLTIKKCDAVVLIRSALDDLIVLYGHRFIFHSIDQLYGQWSESAIQRIIENLCTNAVKYGDANKAITISIRNYNECLEFSVHNEGPTISQEDLKYIFDYKHRTESAELSIQEGSGIGLTVVSALAKAHGGKCNVESTDMSGTTFTVSLPITPNFNIPLEA